MPLFIGIHGAAPLVLWSIMVATVSSLFNNGGCQPLTFQKGCCICQWMVPSIDGCCTLMATNSTFNTVCSKLLMNGKKKTLAKAFQMHYQIQPQYLPTQHRTWMKNYLGTNEI
jgi:hypothetical protein